MSQKKRNHPVEKKMALTADEIMDVVQQNHRLGVALMGAVAEKHLERFLLHHPAVLSVTKIDEDGKHDLDVTFISGETKRIECKLVSSGKPYVDGCYKVDVRKTRSAANNPTKYCYQDDAFDIVAVCFFSKTGHWQDFRFISTQDMPRHKKHVHYLKNLNRIDDTWSTEITDCF